MTQLDMNTPQKLAMAISALEGRFTAPPKPKQAKQKENRKSDEHVKAPVSPPAATDPEEPFVKIPVEVEETIISNADAEVSVTEEASSEVLSNGSETAEVAEVAKQADDAPPGGDESEEATSPVTTKSLPQRQRNNKKGKSKDQKEKGGSDEPSAEQSEDRTVSGNESTAAGKEEEKEKEVRYLYLVRLPRPEGNAQGDAETARLEPLVALRQERIEYLNAAFRVKQVSKSNAQSNTVVALDNLKVVSSEIRSKFDSLRPLQDREKVQREEENTVKSLERELVVKTEEDLDRRLQMLEYKISHESLPLAEEKKMIREIKTLGNLRETVREFQVRKAAVVESRQDRDGEERMLLKVLKEEVELLKMQENILREIFRKRQEEEKEFETSIKAIIQERQQENVAREEIRDKIRAVRNGLRKEEGEYQKNRRLIRKTRELVEKKEFETAESLSHQQVERLHTRLSTDDAFREEYFRLMRKQNPRRYLSDMDDSADQPFKPANKLSTADYKADPASLEAARLKAKVLIQELMALPTPSAPEEAPPPEPLPESPEPPTTPPSGDEKKPPTSVKAETKAPQEAKPKASPNRGRRAAEAPTELRALKASPSAAEDLEALEALKSEAKHKQEEAKERAKRQMERAAEKRALTERHAEEEARKKAERKKAKKTGGKNKSAPEKVQPAAVASVETAAAPVEAAEAAAVKETVKEEEEANKPALRRKVKKGKVVVESAAAAQRRFHQQMMMVVAAVVAMLAMILMMLNSRSPAIVEKATVA